MPPRRSVIAKPTRSAIARAAALIRAGGLVAMPTETVYGLAGDAGNDRAIAAIFAAKQRPRFNPLIVHVPDARAGERLAQFDSRARRLSSAFWPGPLTLVLKRKPGAAISWLASAGLDTLALRVPDHPVARALIRVAGRPIAAPSANRSGKISPTTAEHVESDLGRRVDLILDGGPSRVGIESTVVDLSGRRPTMLRPGGIARESIEALIGPLATPAARHAIRSPGRLRSHYAPNRPLRLNARRPRADEAFLAFGPPAARFSSRAFRNLSPAGDLSEAAANLFAALRAADRPPFRRIAVARIPARGLGLAINDRLRRAAASRFGNAPKFT